MDSMKLEFGVTGKRMVEIVEVEIISHTLEFNGHNAKMILATEITKPKRARKKKI